MTQEMKIEMDGAVQSFTFGDPESVLDGRDLSQYFEIYHNGRYYEPAIAPKNLNKLLHMTPAHESAIRLKVNLLAASLIPNAILSRSEFKKFAMDYMIHGNAYFEKIKNVSGNIIRLKQAPALNMRVGVNDDEYYFLKSGLLDNQHIFAKDTILHLKNPDPNQEIYGMSEYLSAISAGLLNEESTLFRRRYYKNGSHAGFVFLLTEPTVDDASAAAIQKNLESSKGVGNFKNLFVHAPNGKKDAVQIIPISEVAAKDEFMNIKDISRDDVLAAHRVPPQLLGIVPKNTGGFGDIRSASMIFFQHEIQPIQETTREINDMIGREVIQFNEYEPALPASPSPASPPASPRNGGA